MYTYTVFAKFPNNTIEEVDVVAADEAEARDKGAGVLTEEYIPGWEIIDVVVRAGNLFYSW